MRRESATNRCPVCRYTFRTLDDEVGTHPCPRCGWADPGETECPDFDAEVDRRRWDVSR
jgi:hypothetical protein